MKKYKTWTEESASGSTYFNWDFTDEALTAMRKRIPVTVLSRNMIYPIPLPPIRINYIQMFFIIILKQT